MKSQLKNQESLTVPVVDMMYPEDSECVVSPCFKLDDEGKRKVRRSTIRLARPDTCVAREQRSLRQLKSYVEIPEENAVFILVFEWGNECF